MKKDILIPVSLGELIDKLVILEIKLKKIKDEKKIFFVKKERDLLMKEYGSLLSIEDVKVLYEELYTINDELWEIEDLIRIKESKQTFDDEFISLARSVYKTNDKRFKIKNKINELYGSDIIEQKSYTI